MQITGEMANECLPIVTFIGSFNVAPRTAVTPQLQRLTTAATPSTAATRIAVVDGTAC